MGGLAQEPLVAFADDPSMVAAKIAVTDVTDDDIADVVLARPADGGVDLHFLEGGAAPKGRGVYSGHFSRSIEAIQVAAGDVTGDRYGDLVVHAKDGAGAGELWIFRGHAGGLSGTPERVFAGSRLLADVKIVVADLDGDGAAEVVLGRPANRVVELYVYPGGSHSP